MSLILGLAGGLILPDGTIARGSAGVGKDTVADYLEEKYGWIKFAFSDQLYAEVQAAYGLKDQSLLRNRDTKDTPTMDLAGENCADNAFINTLIMAGVTSGATALSPRVVLQWWGTEYRRAQDPDYWLKANDRWLAGHMSEAYPEHRCQYYVNTACRFANEQSWIHARGGNVWHVRRPTVTAPPTHVSEQLLPVLPWERELWNCGTIDSLYKAVDLLMTTSAPVVKALPLQPYVPTTEDLADAQA